MKDVIRNIEAIIFASAEGIDLADIKQILQEALAIEVSKEELRELIKRLKTNIRMKTRYWSCGISIIHISF
ncbi:hypothetical protein KUH03_10935 [Sphingobacterium sp. E70]|uniref:hypothetical protein n=1 Tax=Sphingobacterium sp. E70 TaxID=2853439 RepID=UPI00211BD2F7|nr:hypothetical protein [Sphingobacterium sp. E70]ULT27218.1 hypothetical protein KUH03_10935 [Sphingobacterium sp. E70]